MVSLLNKSIHQQDASPWVMGPLHDLLGAGNRDTNKTPAPGSGEHYMVSQRLETWHKHAIMPPVWSAC